MTEHNVGNDVETANEVVQRLDRQIRVLENEIAKPQSFRVRSQLNTQLREAKALKASIQTAISTGAIKGNSPLFDRQGKPMAKPGSFLFDALKRVEVVTNKGRRGPTNKGKPPSNARTYKPPPKFEVKYNEAKSGTPGQAYPGVSGYVFGQDGTTMVQKVAGEPVPGKFPEINSDGHRLYHVYNEALNPTRIAVMKTPNKGASFDPMVMEAEGTKVPGTVATYYGANAVEPNGKMSRADGTYDAALTLPKDSTSLYPTTKSSQLYMPKPGDAVAGRTATHVHDASKARSPMAFTVGANIPWVGSGTSHVFGTNGQPSQKIAAVAVPGSPGKVWSESLNPLTVQAGVFVPGSGVHSRGGVIRNKVYISTNPSQQLTWTAGADAPWDGDVRTRFNIDGQIQKFAVGEAYPGQANIVFDTDYSQYTKAAGKEVPGSTGYDAADKETGDADGLGPAAQVYDAALNPIDKTRGIAVPGQAPGTIYSSTGADATVTTVVPGQKVLTAFGVDPKSIYSSSFQPVTPSRGLFSPTANPALRHTSIFTSAQDTLNLATVSDPGTPDIDPKDPKFRAPSHQLRLLPLADGDVVKTEAGNFTPFVFDPAFGLFPEDSFAQKIGTEQLPTVLFVPGRPADISTLTQKGQLPIKTDQLFVSTLPDGALLAEPITSDIYTGKQQPIPFREGIDAGLIPGSIRDANVFTIPQDGLTQTQLTVSPGLGGSRSIMFNQGMGASTSTTSSSRSSGAARQHMQDPRSVSRW